MATEMRLALIIEYDGSCYKGFQYQKDLPSVQLEIEKSIFQLTGQKTKIKGAGRTDSGVHALGQVVAFDILSDLPINQIISGLNHYLPKDIVVKAAYSVSNNFDPRRMAISRTYKYSIVNRNFRAPLQMQYSALVRQRLDVVQMRLTANLMLGTHDFSAFAGALPAITDSTVRNIDRIDILVIGDNIEIEVEGNAFLPHQVRRMVGAIIDVGLGKTPLAQIKLMLSADENTIEVKTRSMPPEGLCLVKVLYENFPPEKKIENDYTYKALQHKKN